MDEELDIREYLNLLRRHWISVAIAVILVFTLVLIYTLLATPIYEAKSLVMVTNQDQTSLLLGQNGNGLDLGTQKELILSASVLAPVYAQYPPKSFDLGVQNIKDTNVIEIDVQSSSPEDAMNIANGIAESYVNYTKESKKNDALQVTSFISEQIDKYNSEITDLNTILLYYKNNTNLTDSETIKSQSLQQELDAKEKLYNYLLSRKEETSITANENLGNIKIIEYAAIPQMPIKPNIFLNLSIGFILAIIAGMAVVYFKAEPKIVQKKRF